MFRHLLVPTDGSQLSERAVKQAISFAEKARAKVTFFYARSDAEASLYGESALLRSMDPTLLVNDEMLAHEILRGAEEQGKRAGVECESLLMVSAEPYEGIIAAAQDRECDLIVMASHGHRGVKGLLLGSQTQKVLTHSTIPVLVYR